MQSVRSHLPVNLAFVVLMSWSRSPFGIILWRFYDAIFWAVVPAIAFGAVYLRIQRAIDDRWLRSSPQY